MPNLVGAQLSPFFNGFKKHLLPIFLLFLFLNGIQVKFCSGSIKPDTNVGGNIATINEVSDDQETTIFYAGIQAVSRLFGA